MQAYVVYIACACQIFVSAQWLGARAVAEPDSDEWRERSALSDLKLGIWGPLVSRGYMSEAVVGARLGL